LLYPDRNAGEHALKRTSCAGYSLVDLLAVLSLAAILMVISVPAVSGMGDSVRLSSSMRDVERELQTARLKAVTANRPMRVRFNCPAAGQFRMVEVIGTKSVPAAADSAAASTRCSETTYPYPAADANPLTLPNADGPVRRLGRGVTFGTAATVEFWPDGSAHAAGAAGTSPWPAIAPAGVQVTVVQVSNGVPATRAITVNGLGKIQIQR
jgi:Tfp pilus assembly protein FimT